MLHDINLCQKTSLHGSTRMKPPFVPFVPFDKPNICNDYIFMESEYNDRSCYLIQVDLNTNMVDNVLLKKVVVQPTKKPRSVGPHKSKLKKTTNKKRSRLNNKKSRSVSTQLRKGSTEPNSDEINMLLKRIFYKNKDMKNYPFISAGTSIPIVTWKLTKNCSHIVTNRPLSSCSLFYENNQRSKLEVESSSLPMNNIGLLYRLIGKLWFISGITRPDVQTCVTYILTMMELPTNYRKNRNLNTDLLLTKKI